MSELELPEVLTPYDVAQLFSVSPKTVTRWAKAGRLSSFLTPGRHHRFRRADVLALLPSAATEAASGDVRPRSDRLDRLEG